MEICPQDKRVSLEIRFDDDGKVSLARCCFLYAFSHLTLEEYGKIDDIIDFAENQKINYAKSSNICVAKCFLEKKIKQVDVGISHACNMRCLNCFFKEHKDTPEMKKAYFDTLYKIKGHQLDTIMMNNGGEVFVYYKEIVEYLKSLTPNDTRQVTFVTNLVLLNEEKLKELKKISEETGVNYFFLPSVDGITKESYEAIRIGGTFEKITENLKLLSDIFGSQNAVILYTIKKPNINETEKVEKYFLDNFDLRSSISFDVYDKECEKRYNSIFRKDFSSKEVEVSQKEEPEFKFEETQEQVKRKVLSIVTDTIPSEDDVKAFSNMKQVFLFIFGKKEPKWLKKYDYAFFVKSNKRNFYKNLNSRVYTKYFLYIENIHNLVINSSDILCYYLEHSNANLMKIKNCIKSGNSITQFSDDTYSLLSYSLIIKSDFFRKNLANIEISKKISLDFIKNIHHFLKNSSAKEIPEEVIYLLDLKLYKGFFKWNFVQTQTELL